MIATDPPPAAPKPIRHWYSITPGRLLAVLLTVEVLLWLSGRFQWFAWREGGTYLWYVLAFNARKGWAAQITAAACVLVIAVLLLWFVASLLRRRPFQFGVRSFGVLVVVVAIPCSWLAVEMEKARPQREALEAVKALGGEVLYDWQSGDVINDPVPMWLMRLFGEDVFSDVETVTVATDAPMRYLKAFPHLQRLTLHRVDADHNEQGRHRVRSAVTDLGLKYIEGFHELQHLEMDGTNVTDAGLEHLKGLPQLWHLSLEGTKVTDAGLKHLEGLTQLELLWLNGTNVTDAGLKHLKGLIHLNWLDLSKTKVTDTGIDKLQQALPNCNIYWQPPTPDERQSPAKPDQPGG